MKPLVSFISNSSIFISIMALCLSLFYSKITDTAIDYNRLIVIFFGTLISYIGVQLIPITENKINNKRTDWIKSYKTILIILMVTSLLVIILSIKYLNSYDLLNFIHLFILVLFYEKIFIKKNELRKIPYFKPLLIAYIWACTCTAPVLYLNLDSINYWIWIECFLFILSLAIPFDIRDLETDSLESIKTIPIKFGIKNSRFICLFLFLCSLVLQFQYIELNLMSIIITLLFCIIYIVLLKNTWPGQKDEYFLYGFDGLMAFKLLYLMVI
jgi:4-hydroxybenzoate polyprenyltransferase